MVLSSHKDRQYVANFSLEEAQGWFCLLKYNAQDAQALMRALRGTLWRQMTVDREVLAQLVPCSDSALAQLLNMQREALGLMVQGDIGIAEMLGLPESYALEEISTLVRTLGLEQGEGVIGAHKGDAGISSGHQSRSGELSPGRRAWL